MSIQTNLDRTRVETPPSLTVLTERYKVIRDPVHGDIWLTELETRLIDTRSFQRLRHIRQLGTSYLLYPGAVHTRFEHSIGTLQMAWRMVEAINSNRFGDLRIEDPREVQLIRCAALLHDLAHIPFGHTLEDEGNLLSSQWDDPSREDPLIGPGSEIGKILASWFTSAELGELRSVLLAKEDPAASGRPSTVALPRPYIADIVGNTLCSDLLDYLRRDLYFCGLREAYDERFLNYLVIVADKSGKHRLALRLVNKKGRLRRDNISEVIHLLRLRYSLAEKVYYHTAKVASSAMVIEAVRLELDSIRDQLLNEGDDTLMARLRQSANPDVSSLVESLERHSLFSEVYRHSYRPASMGDPESAKREEVAERLRSPAARGELQHDLEQQIVHNVPWGSVLVYCPDYRMGLKAANVLVIWKGDRVTRLGEIPDEHIRQEVDQIKEDHRRLWALSVFFRPEVPGMDADTWLAAAKGIAHDAEKLTGLTNQQEFYQGETRDWSVRAIEYFSKKFVVANPKAPPITHEEFEALAREAVSAYDPNRDRGAAGRRRAMEYSDFERILHSVR